jgi:hypothetical protein
LSKLANRQYVLINLVEAPGIGLPHGVLPEVLPDSRPAANMSSAQNDNIPQYLFIAVIVALFLGLTVSAEEIIRDRKILATREIPRPELAELFAQQDRASSS